MGAIADAATGLCVGNMVEHPSVPGIGRVGAVDGDRVRVDCFESVAAPVVGSCWVAATECRLARLLSQTRVYWQDPDTGNWRAGRIVGGDASQYFIRLLAPSRPGWPMEPQSRVSLHQWYPHSGFSRASRRTRILYYRQITTRQQRCRENSPSTEPGALQSFRRKRGATVDARQQSGNSPFEVPASLRERARGIVGRQWVVDRVLDWLQHGSERYFLLTGAPGTGKSTIAAWLAMASPDGDGDGEDLGTVRAAWSARHFCMMRGAGGSVDPRRFTQLVANQLANRYDEFALAVAPSIGPQYNIRLEGRENC